jgi:N4-gp56 family major capsid protein
VTELYATAGFTEEARIFYVMQLLARAQPYLKHAGWGVQRSIPRNQGIVANMRRLEQVPGNVSWIANEGTPPTATNVTWSSVAITARQYGAFDFISDVAQSQSIDNVVAEMSDMFAGQRARTIDFLARDIMVAGTNVTYRTGTAATAISTGSVMNAATLLGGVASLKKRGAPGHPKAGGRFPCITHPDVYVDMLLDSNISAALQYALPRGGDNPLFTGGSFDFGGARIIEASNARVRPSGGLSVNIAVYVTQLLGDGYYGEVTLAELGDDIIVKPVGSAGADDPLNQYGTVGWKTSYAAAILNGNFGQRLETASTKNDTTIVVHPTT